VTLTDLQPDVAAPSEGALRWVARSIAPGATVRTVRRLTGGISSAMYADRWLIRKVATVVACSGVGSVITRAMERSAYDVKRGFSKDSSEPTSPRHGSSVSTPMVTSVANPRCS